MVVTHYSRTALRKDCTEHYQDLRNGCQVRLSGRKVYIYRNGYSILYGDEITLLYSGFYRVRGNYVTYVE